MQYINYNEIDVLCRPIVKYFNAIGLDTKFSCQGHEGLNRSFQIMFQDYVTDEQIQSFLEQYSSKFSHSPFVGHFQKWMRKMSGKIATNWIYEVNFSPDYRMNQLRAQDDLKIMKNDGYCSC